MIKLQNYKALVELKKKEYKYLSPFVFYHKKNYYLFFCNRGKTNNFYGEINLLKSKDLLNWKRVRNFCIKPDKNSSIISYTSPCLVKKDFYYLYIQAQGKNFFSKIIRYKSKNFKSWNKDKNFKLEEKGFIVKSPYYSEYDNKYLYYSKENNSKKYISKINLENKKKFNLIKSENKNENYSIYSPTITKYKNYFIMLYSAWKNANEGNIKLAISKNLKIWYKCKNYLFKLPKKIKIISEPNMIKKENCVYLFYEFKENLTYWNLASKKIYLKKIIKNNRWNLSSKKIDPNIIDKIIK